MEIDSIGVFRGPSEVIIGDGSAGKVGEMLDGWNLREGPLLVVCDKTVAELGLLDRVLGSLSGGPRRIDVFDEVANEPDLAMATSVTEKVRSDSYVAVIGLGGGSSLDLAKLAAGFATNQGDVLDAVGVNQFANPSLPLVLIPTTAGTGAEATRISMFSHEGNKKIVNDVQLIARAVILDPFLVSSLPPSITAMTGLDALSHAIEGALSTNATALSTRSSFQAVELLAVSLPAAYRNGDDLRARRGCLIGSYLAGLALNAGSTLGHSIGYTIANRVKVPHGSSVALALPYCIAYAAPASKKRIDALFARVDNSDLKHSDIFSWLEGLLEELGVPMSLEALGLSKVDAEDMARECVAKYPRPNNPTPLEEEGLLELYRFMWSGDLRGAVARFAPNLM